MTDATSEQLDKFIKQVTGLVQETGLQPAVLILVGEGRKMSTMIYPRNLSALAVKRLLITSLASFVDPTATTTRESYIHEGEGAA